MAVVSKELFHERMNDSLDCSLVHTWENSCLKANISPHWLISKIAIGSAKFFLPIYIIKMLFNYKKIKDKRFLKSLVLSEVRSTVYGIVMAFLLLSSICTFRYIYGRFHYYSLLMYPGMISGLSLLVESEENHILDTLSFFNSFVETVLNKLRLTKYIQTLLFMTTSGLLMHIFHNRQKNFNFVYLWFYTPSKQTEQDKTATCSHTDICEKYYFEGFYKYFSLGYAVNIVRRLIPRLKVLTNKPSEMWNVIVSKENLKFGLFIGGYVGLYRMLVCKLTKIPQISHQLRGLIGGTLSGMTYMISPNIHVLGIALTTLFQLFYHYLAETLKITNHFWQRQILFMICHGYLLHNKMLFTSDCSPWYSKMIDACTNNETINIYQNVVLHYFG